MENDFVSAYGILITKTNVAPHRLIMCGYDYPTLDCYLEEDFPNSRWHREGWKAQIVSVHKEDGRWVC